MTAFLDEGVPVRLARTLTDAGRPVAGFPNAWKGLRNGDLLQRLVEQGATCLVTSDKNMRHQQNLASAGLALIVLPRQRFDDLRPLIPSILDAIDRAQRGEILVILSDGSIEGSRS